MPLNVLNVSPVLIEAEASRASFFRSILQAGVILGNKRVWIVLLFDSNKC